MSTIGTVVVAGATGGIGEGAVRALLDRADTVVAVGRDEKRLLALASRLGTDHAGRLVLLEADVTSVDSATVAERVRDAAGGPVDGVLITIGTTPSPGPGTLLDIPDDDVRAAVDVNELGSLRAWRALVPCVRPQGAVVTILGFSAEIPFPGNPLMGSTNAAVRSWVTSLAAQLAGTGPRFYGLLVGVVRTRARQRAGVDHPGWLTGEQLGVHTAALITGDVDRPAQPLRYYLDPVTGPTLAPRS